MTEISFDLELIRKVLPNRPKYWNTKELCLFFDKIDFDEIKDILSIKKKKDYILF